MEFDKTLIGRQYWIHPSTTKYTLRGIYVLPQQKPIVLGEYEDTQVKVTRLIDSKM